MDTNAAPASIFAASNTATDVPNPEDALSRIRVTETDGTVHIIDDAFIAGVWSGRLIVSGIKKSEPRKSSIGFTVQNEERTDHFLPLAQIDRVEVSVWDDMEGSETEENLHAVGFLGFDNELDLDGERTGKFVESREDWDAAKANNNWR